MTQAMLVVDAFGKLFLIAGRAIFNNDESSATRKVIDAAVASTARFRRLEFPATTANFKDDLLANDKMASAATLCNRILVGMEHVKTRRTIAELQDTALCLSQRDQICALRRLARGAGTQ